MTATTAPTDIDALKDRLKATWMDGNYDYFSRFMESSAAQFLDRLDVPAGASLLDVACGSGQLGLIAARRGLRVTGVDIATGSILAARGRAASEGLDAQFDEPVFVVFDVAGLHGRGSPGKSSRCGRAGWERQATV